MIVDVFHVPVPLAVEFVEDRVVHAVEIQGLDAEALAEGEVEGRRGLDPAAAEKHLRVAVKDEKVGLHDLFQPFGGQMVPDVRETEPARNAQDAGGGGQQQRLFNAVPGLFLEDHAGLEPVPHQVDAIGVVPDRVADGIEDPDGPVHRGGRISRCFPCEPNDGGVVAVDKKGRMQIFVKRSGRCCCHDTPLRLN